MPGAPPIAVGRNPGEAGGARGEATVHGQVLVHRTLDAVLSLVADTDEVVARLLRRAEIEGRSDDSEETIRVRLQVYAEQTEPLLEVYRPRGLLVEVDGLGEIDDVSERVFAALDAHREGRAAELVD